MQFNLEIEFDILDIYIYIYIYIYISKIINTMQHVFMPNITLISSNEIHEIVNNIR